MNDLQSLCQWGAVLEGRSSWLSEPYPVRVRSGERRDAKKPHSLPPPFRKRSGGLSKPRLSVGRKILTGVLKHMVESKTSRRSRG